MNTYFLYSYRKILKLGFGKHYGSPMNYNPSRVGSYRPTYVEYYASYAHRQPMWSIYRRRKMNRRYAAVRCKGYPNGG